MARLIVIASGLALLLCVILSAPCYAYVLIALIGAIAALFGVRSDLEGHLPRDNGGSASVPSRLIPVAPRGSAGNEEPLPRLDDLAKEMLEQADKEDKRTR